MSELKSSYHCCKNRVFTHYVCINCHSLFHKSCLPKYKSKIKFVSEHKISCCEQESERQLDDNPSILEQTLSDLTFDSELKDKQLEKLKVDCKLLLKEASEREEELNEILARQEEAIEEYKQLISSLKKSITDSKKTTKSVYVQATPVMKSTEVETDCCLDKVQVDDKDPGDEIIRSIPSRNSTWTVNLENKKKQVLIVGDELARGLQNSIGNQLDSNTFNVVSILKPGALLHQVLENIGSLVRDFSCSDYVIIVGGSNDVSLCRYPSFRKICDKLKAIRHTNIIFTSIPYSSGNLGQHKNVFRFNDKLNALLNRFDRFVEGNFIYFDSNAYVGSNYKINLASVAKTLSLTICTSKSPQKNLIFIHTTTCNHVGSDSIEDAATISLEKGSDLTIYSTTENQTMDSFLYPRLSELNLDM